MSFWDKITDEETRRNLRASDRDGSFWAVMFGFGESFIQPFAIALKASNVEIAALTSVPHLIGSLIQPFAADLIDRMRLRKRIVLTTVVLQALMWLPLLGLPLLMRTRAVPLLILLYTGYFLLSRFTGPAWISWIGDIVPARLRGEYFGQRNTLIQIVSVLSTFAAGALLGLFENTNEMLGFALIFVIACVARLISVGYLNQMSEPEYKPLKEDRFTFRNFLRRLPRSNYGNFVIFNVLFRFGTAFASPFFALYLLRDLQFTYIAYTVIILSVTVAKVLTIRYWGRYGDRFGNMKIIYVTALLIPIVPVLWLVSARLWWLVLVNLFAGAMWGGYELSSANFLFDSVKPTKRVRVFAYHDTLHSVFLFAGAMTGGFLSTQVPVLPGMAYNLLTIFLISGILRLLATVLFLPRVKEVREVERITGARLLFAYMAVEPLEDAVYGAFHGARHGAKFISRIGIKSVRTGVRSVDRVYKGTFKRKIKS